MMIAAMSWGWSAKARSISVTARRSCSAVRAITSSVSGNDSLGLVILGQSNRGNPSTLTGSVLVSDMVYPLRP